VSSGTILGSDTVCQGETQVSYNIPVIDNTLSYVWVLPPGATINSGVGTDSITVDFDMSANTGTFFITVQALNSCGIGITTSSFEVTVKPTPVMDPVMDQILCGNELTDTVMFSGGPIGTMYDWTNDNFAIGLDSMGTGDINSIHHHQYRQCGRYGHGYRYSFIDGMRWRYDHLPLCSESCRHQCGARPDGLQRCDDQ
jgi:hypothetical protein